MKKVSHTNHRQRMRDKYLAYGIEPFADHEVLELILYYAIPRVDTNPIGHRLIDRFGSLAGVLNADINALKQVEGIGPNAAILINMFGKLKDRYVFSDKKNFPLINTVQAKKYCESLYTNFNKEQFFIICLTGANQVISKKLIKTGDLVSIDLKIRDITTFALNNNCNRIIISHCHTGYSSLPSAEDYSFTKILACSCLINDIDLLDHIVVSANGSTSMAEQGTLNEIKRSAFESIPLPNKKEAHDRLATNNFASDNYTSINN